MRPRNDAYHLAGGDAGAIASSSKLKWVAACQGPGVSLAAVALHHKPNANLLRRWIEKAEGNDRVLVARSEVSVPSAAVPAPAFVPLPLETRNARTAEIRVEVRRADQSITVSWPTSEAAQCAAWQREWLA